MLTPKSVEVFARLSSLILLLENRKWTLNWKRFLYHKSASTARPKSFLLCNDTKTDFLTKLWSLKRNLEPVHCRQIWYFNPANLNYIENYIWARFTIALVKLIEVIRYYGISWIYIEVHNYYMINIFSEKLYLKY